MPEEDAPLAAAVARSGSTAQEVMERVIEHADKEMADDPPFDTDEARPDAGGYASDTEGEAEGEEEPQQQQQQPAAAAGGGA